MAGLNPLQYLSAGLGIAQGIGGKFQARGRIKAREQANLGTLPDQSEWGDIRPDEATIQQALESSAGRGGQNRQGEYRNPVTERFASAARNYTANQALRPDTAFDQQAWADMVQWARVHDEALYWNLVGGPGAEVLMGYDAEGARGQDPDALTPENFARHLEEGTTPTLPDHISGYDVATILAKFDFPRAMQNWEGEVDAAEAFQESNLALLGRDGELHGDITSARDSSLAAVQDITALTRGGIDTAREENRLGRERFQDNFQAGLDRSEARRTRGLDEFVDDTAQRIESERLGLNSRMASDREQMMQEMQAQGMSQREITAAIRTQVFSHRSELTQLSIQHNIAVATERSALGLSYDTLTASYDAQGLSGMNALELANTVAETGFATLTAQAAESVARNTIVVEQNAVTLRGQADMALLSNQVVYGDMLNRLSATMPEMGTYAAVIMEAERYEDAILQGIWQEGEASLTMAIDRLGALGDREMEADIATDAQEAADSGPGVFGYANMGIQTITGGITAGASAAAALG